MNWLELLIGAIGGASAMLAALYFLSGKLVGHWLAKDLENYRIELKRLADRDIEGLKADLAYRNALAQARIEHLRSLWEATYRYGGTVSMYADGATEEVNRRISEFNGVISRTGVFIGHRRYENILRRIGSPLLAKLEAAAKNPEERRRVFDEFRQRDWIMVLDEIEKLLNENLLKLEQSN